MIAFGRRTGATPANQALCMLLARVPASQIADDLRMSVPDLGALTSTPEEMSPTLRLRLAVCLRNRAYQTPDPAGAIACAYALWETGVDLVAMKTVALFADVSAPTSVELEARLAALVLEEFGPEILEHMPVLPRMPNT